MAEHDFADTVRVNSKSMRSNKSKDTRLEMIVRKALWSEGLKGYRLHVRRLPGTPDIVYTKWKIAIFVNGCYWHRCSHCNPPTPKTNAEFWRNKFISNKERDKRVQRELIDMGWSVFIFWECKIAAELPKEIETFKDKLPTLV